MTAGEWNRSLSLHAIRTELACARALLDELEARFSSGDASIGARNVASQTADELTRVAGAMKGWAALAESDVFREVAP